MPRKSKAAIEIEQFLTPSVERLSCIAPPDDIPVNVRELMNDLIASQPASHWRSGDEYLVEQHAQSILAAREAHAHLQAEGYVLDGKPNPWINIWEKSTRASVALAAKLRLAPQQRHDAKHAAREADYDQFGNRARSWT
jgi:hypothetical protein